MLLSTALSATRRQQRRYAVARAICTHIICTGHRSSWALEGDARHVAEKNMAPSHYLWARAREKVVVQVQPREARELGQSVARNGPGQAIRVEIDLR